jgi:hypothetical protein
VKITFYGLMSRCTIIVFLSVLASCGLTPQQTAHVSLGVAASGVRAVDIVSAQAYTDRARTALAASSSLTDYQTTMQPLDLLESSLRIADEALLAAEAAVNAWDNGGASRWLALAACVAQALHEIERAINAAGVQLPSELVQALDVATTFVGTCQHVDPAPTSGGAS